MGQSTAMSIALPAVCLSLVGILSIPAFRQYIVRFQQRKDQYEHVSGHYEDEDGAATEESQDAHKDFIPRLILILVAAVATFDALAAAFLLTTRPDRPLTVEQWLQFSIWASEAAIRINLIH